MTSPSTLPLWRQLQDAKNAYNGSSELQAQFTPSEWELPGRPESQRRWAGMKRYLGSLGLPTD